MVSISGIYVIRNKKSGKVYIGSSVCIRKRLNQHRNDLRQNRHHNEHLQRSWNKYGESAFEFKTLERCGINELLEREQFWIDTIDDTLLYNISQNTLAPMSGLKHTVETKTKMANAQRGRRHSEETKLKISRAISGRKLSPERIKQMSVERKGSKASEETRAKLREIHKTPSPELRYKFGNANRGRKLPREQVEKSAQSRMQQYVMIAPDGTEYAIIGLAKFCREHDLDQGTMSRAMKQGVKHKGWICKKV